EYSNPKTPQQNKVTERKNRTLIEAARTMLADSKLPTMFWTEAVKTACYVLNKVSVTSPHNKTPYALLSGNIPTVSHFKPFGCHVTILNTSDNIGKFDRKADEGYIVGYSASNKAYRVYNVPNKRAIIMFQLTNLQAHKETHLILQGTQPIDTPGANVDDSPFSSVDKTFQKELARLTGEGHRDTSYADSLTLGTEHNAEDSSKCPTSSSWLHSRSYCLSDLGNHNPSPGIFSSSSYDDKFDTALNNVASSVEALEDPSWVDAMQEEMQQFKFQNVWVLVDLPQGKYTIGTKWILKNKRDARRIVIHNKARLVTQGHRQEEGIDYDEVFALEVYVTQPKGFVDPQHPKKVYKEWCDEFEALMKGEFQMSAIGELTFFLGLQVQQSPNGIFIHQVKYAHEILNKFNLGNVRTATTPYEAPKPKSKSESDIPVNVHLYRSMIGSLMYLIASRPDIIFAVSACSRHQVTHTTSNLEVVKKIFKYLKGQPKLGLWYPKESPLVLEAYSDSDYAGANKDRKFTTGGCQFLGTLDTKSVVRL
nr:retrovirus-related Pol polyprotein from transposon TNT 1-94 [Tanacetum cinerariifolium]